MINLDRRKFLSAVGSLIAAPAIVRASELMPVRAHSPIWSIYNFGMNNGDAGAPAGIMQALQSAYPGYEIKYRNSAVGIPPWMRVMPALVIVPTEKVVVYTAEQYRHPVR